MRRNIELKARCPDLDSARQATCRLGARFQGVLLQTDTYFAAARGRLKLRQIDAELAELIWYARANATTFRPSDYIIAPVSDVPATLAALVAALGIRGVIRKRRALYLYENVRIHLDDVENLGAFIEFEAVIANPPDEIPSRPRLAILRQALAIRDEDVVAQSYSDLAGF